MEIKQKCLSPFHVVNNKLTIWIKMSNKIKDKDIKNHAYYFFNDIINIKNMIQIKLKKIKSHAKILLFTTLDM